MPSPAHAFGGNGASEKLMSFPRSRGRPALKHCLPIALCSPPRVSASQRLFDSLSAGCYGSYVAFGVNYSTPLSYSLLIYKTGTLLFTS